MLYPSPSHISDYVVRLPEKNIFLSDKFDDYTMPYKIKCDCESEQFEVFIDSDPTVVVKCSNCGKEIIVYDLRYYPAASFVEEDEELRKYKSAKGDMIFKVCVIYEYSDEFEFWDDEFDKNDITWCHVYLYGVESKKTFKIVDDETA